MPESVTHGTLIRFRSSVATRARCRAGAGWATGLHWRLPGRPSWNTSNPIPFWMRWSAEARSASTASSTGRASAQCWSDSSTVRLGNRAHHAAIPQRQKRKQMNTVEMKHRKNVDTVRVIAVPTPEGPLEVVIDRAKWHRGKGGPGSKLITFDGKMCCLGFDALACGLKHDDINLVCDPASTGFGIPGLVDITYAPFG